MVRRVHLTSDPEPRLRMAIPGVEPSAAVGLEKTFDSLWFSNLPIIHKGYVNNVTSYGQQYFTLPSNPGYIPFVLTMTQTDFTGLIECPGDGTVLDMATLGLKHYRSDFEPATYDAVRIVYAVIAVPLNDIADNPTKVPGTSRIYIDNNEFRCTPPGINARTAPTQRCILDSSAVTLQIVDRPTFNRNDAVIKGSYYVWEYAPPVSATSNLGRWMFMGFYSTGDFITFTRGTVPGNAQFPGFSVTPGNIDIISGRTFSGAPQVDATGYWIWLGY